MLKRLFFVGLILTLLGAALPVWAQTLPPDQQALFDQMVAANATLNGYDSYIKISKETTSQQLSVVSEGTIVNEQITETVVDSLSAVIRGDSPNGFYAEFRTVTEQDEAYTLQGELRFVDGVLYGLGDYSEGTGPYVFPEGFITLTNPADAGELRVLEPESFVNEISGIPTEDNVFTQIDLLQTVAESVSAEPSELDGVPVQVITLTIADSGLLTLLTTLGADGADDPTLAALFAFMSPDSGAIISLALDPNGDVRQATAEINIEITDADMSQIDNTLPPGMLANLLMSMSISETYSDLNAVAEPVTAP